MFFIFFGVRDFWVVFVDKGKFIRIGRFGGFFLVGGGFKDVG